MDSILSSFLVVLLCAGTLAGKTYSTSTTPDTRELREDEYLQIKQNMQKSQQLCSRCDCYALHNSGVVFQRVEVNDDLDNLDVLDGNSTVRTAPNFEILVINCTSRLDAHQLPRWAWPAKLSAGLLGSAQTWAEFRSGQLNEMVRLPRLPFNLTRLSLAENQMDSIASRAFANLVHLIHLDLSKNSLSDIPYDAFLGLVSLERLDLSDNALGTAKVPQALLRELNALTELNMKNNSLQGIITGDSLPGCPGLRLLDLSHNNFTSIDGSAWTKLSNLTELNLSWNRLSSLSPGSFSRLTALQRLDISHNPLVNVPSDVLEGLLTLHTLDISHCPLGTTDNEVEGIERSLLLPKSLVRLRASSCKLADFHPQRWGGLHDLERLDISQNDIGMLDDIAHLSKLQEFNVSHNGIVRFPVVALQSLEILDVSYNELEAAPALSMTLTPRIRVLNLDGNKMEELHMTVPSSLKILSIKQMSRLHQLPAQAIVLEGNSTDPPSSDANESSCSDGLALWVSHNAKLDRIHNQAFHGVPLCQLDVSHNSLTALSEELTNWSKLDVVDLQSNPWECSCKIQWVLDSLMPQLYRTRPDLLQELRCGSPEAFKGKRLAYWYNHTSGAFCGGKEQIVLRGGFGGSDSSVTLGMSTGTLTVIAVLSVVALLLVILGIIAHRRHIQRVRTRNRRL